MMLTIEPTEDQSGRSADTMHSKVSVSIASDDLDIGETMGQVVKALQAWGFHNESIAKELGHELAWELGLKKEIPDMDKTKFAVGNLLDQKPLDPALEHDDWENEGGSNLSNLPEEGCEGGHY